MANTQISVNKNGKTTLATAGKYCDRNIDVNVDVAGKPTQFTNLYDPANVTVKTRFEASASIGYAYTADNYCNCIKIPYHHKVGEPVVMRIRGIGTVRDRYNSATFKQDGTTKVNHYSLIHTSTTQYEMSFDEYGDAMITFKGVLLSVEWYYFVFNFQYVGINANATAITGPIITINEPIGNGGYIG